MNDPQTNAPPVLPHIATALPGAVFEMREDRAGNVSFVFLSDEFQRIFRADLAVLYSDFTHFAELLYTADRESWLFSRMGAISAGPIGVNNNYLWQWEGRLQRDPSLYVQLRANGWSPEDSENELLWRGWFIEISDDVKARKQAELLQKCTSYLLELSQQLAATNTVDVNAILKKTTGVLQTNTDVDLVVVYSAPDLEQQFVENPWPVNVVAQSSHAGLNKPKITSDPFSLATFLPEQLQALQNGEFIVVNDAAVLYNTGTHSAFSSFFQNYSILSALFLPLRNRNRLHSIIAFYSCSVVRNFDVEEIRTLHSAMSMLSSAIERQQARLALAQSEHLHNLVVSTISDGVAVIDIHGKIRTYNDAAARLFGLPDSPPQRHSAHTENHVGADCIGLENIGRFYNQNHQPISWDVLLQQSRSITGFHKQGVALSQIRWLSITCSPLSDDDVVVSRQSLATHTRYVCSFCDITSEITQKQALQTAKDAAVASSKIKTMFLSLLNHEVRTPLNALVGISDILSHTTLNQMQKDYVETARSSASALSHMLSAMLEFAAVDSGQTVVSPKPTNIVTLAQNIAMQRAGERKLDAENLELYIDIDPNIPSLLWIDSDKVLRIVNILIDNAIRYTDHGSVRVSFSWSRGIKGDSLRITVMDTGVGMDAAQQEQLFLFNSPADSSSNRSRGGLGLSLAIAQGLAKLLGGNIRCETRMNAGSTFSVDISALLDEKASFDNVIPLTAAQHNDAISKQIHNRLRAFWHGHPQFDALPQMHHTQNIHIESLPVDFTAACQHLENYFSHKQAPYQYIIYWSCHQLIQQNITAPQLAILLTKLSKQAPQTSIDFIVYGYRAELDRYAPPAILQTSEKPITSAAIFDQAINLYRRETLFYKAMQQQPRVLIVDDIVINRVIVRKLLEKLGCTCQEASSGPEAINLVLQEDFDLVFMDCQMPSMDGFETTQRIRALDERQLKNTKQLPIVALTANSTDDDRQRCYNAGMNDFYTKPVDMLLMQRILNTHLAH